MRTWIRDPLAILAEGAERGLVVEGTRIAALVGRGETPERIDAVFDASRHVVLPGLVNTHHHFYQTLTRAHPAAINKALFPVADLRSIRSGRGSSRGICGSPSRLALAELLLSGCTTAADHHYLYPGGPRGRGRHRGRGGARARHAHDRVARLDEPLAEGRRPAARQRGAGRGRRSSPTASGC